MTGVMAAFLFSYRQRNLYHRLYQSEQERHQAEEEIHAAFYSIGDGVISTDAVGGVTRMNPVAEQLTGWKEAEALGKPSGQVFRIVNEETRAEVESPVARVMRDGTIVNLANHTLLVARDGTEWPIADSGVADSGREGSCHRRGAGLPRPDRGSPDGAGAARQRITPPHPLREFVGRRDDPGAPSWRFTSCNPATVRMFNVKDEAEFTSLGPWQLSPEVQPDGRPSAEKAKEMIETAMREGSHFFEWRHKRLGGGDFPATVLLTRMEIVGQAVLQATVRDITVQKRAEEGLRDSEEWYRTLFVEARDGICLVDAKTGLIIDCNQALTALVGRDKAELIGQPQTVLHPPADDNGPFSPTFRQHLGDKAGQILDTQVVSSTGEIKEVAIRARTLALGGRTVMQGLFRDTTDRKRAEEQLQNYAVELELANKALEESKHLAECANRAKSDFLANMSHEIRTPMTSILGYTDLLMDDLLSVNDRKTFLTTMRRNGEHLLQVINDILDLSKIEAGKMAMELGPCHLPSTIADVASMMRPAGRATREHPSGELRQSVAREDSYRCNKASASAGQPGGERGQVH